jgi:hypothetical protein
VPRVRPKRRRRSICLGWRRPNLVIANDPSARDRQHTALQSRRANPAILTDRRALLLKFVGQNRVALPSQEDKQHRSPHASDDALRGGRQFNRGDHW